ncbi:alpha-ribazole phosphatase [Clostridium ganghwense]|uniref:Alpha-ribazole phosphatase n=1 Tax=Clostridium ganghwense TaxID=312089 RepID=A0ABT4CT02_9CLOT|nr:alpha-ribazole phosphatase [Clostridium ganghwense]MCY6372182.1 alpha-ribazole phosphatase [Clostridium ganghwense]
MNIYFLRHGQTEQNKNKTYYGRLDVKLNSTGIIQAEKAGEFFKNIELDKVFISEKTRTLQTAEIVLKGRETKLIKDRRINEIDFGVFEGKTYDEICKLYPEEVKLWEKEWERFCPMNGESYEMFYKRVKSFMEDIKKLDAENILVVAHGGVIRAVYSYILDENLRFYWKFSSRNGDISLIKYKYGDFFIDSIMHVD